MTPSTRSPEGTPRTEFAGAVAQQIPDALTHARPAATPAEGLRRLLDAVDRGEITAETPAEVRQLRRIEGAVAVLEVSSPPRR